MSRLRQVQLDAAQSAFADAKDALARALAQHKLAAIDVHHAQTALAARPAVARTRAGRMQHIERYRDVARARLAKAEAHEAAAKRHLVATQRLVEECRTGLAQAMQQRQAAQKQAERVERQEARVKGRRQDGAQADSYRPKRR